MASARSYTYTRLDRSRVLNVGWVGGVQNQHSDIPLGMGEGAESAPSTRRRRPCEFDGSGFKPTREMQSVRDACTSSVNRKGRRRPGGGDSAAPPALLKGGTSVSLTLSIWILTLNGSTCIRNPVERTWHQPMAFADGDAPGAAGKPCRHHENQRCRPIELRAP